MLISILGRNPTVIVIGESGAGKSSCCNIFAGEPHNSSLFPVSQISEETTQETKIYSAKYRGQSDWPVTLVDTQGFNDPNAAGGSKREANQAIIMELMKKITKIPYINLFLICVNGTTLRRLNYSLIYMIQTFEEVFGLRIKAGVVVKDRDTFWHKCVIIITNTPMDRRSIIRRVGCYDVSKDREILQKQLYELTNELGVDIPTFFVIDAKYNKDDEEETRAFNDAITQLYNHMKITPPAMTEAMHYQHEEKKVLLKRLESKEVLDNQGIELAAYFIFSMKTL